MSNGDLKDLELRLERIEKAIDTLAKPARSGTALSEADVAAFHRVREVLWEDGCCGINETSPCVISCIIVDKICKVIPIPQPCDFECSCGPCNIFTEFGTLNGGLARFSRLGRFGR